MRILFDHSTPAPLRKRLGAHEVKEAVELGWDRLSNGELLAEAERAGFEVIITADKNIQYQQNLKGRKIALVVLGNAQWPILRLHVELVVRAVNAAVPGSYNEVEIPG
jgi:predicted nuclease of predicted toxin-antitoxin system